ncbi:MAG: hypothetical protein AAF468_07520 [Pseudomonadota bacterium]
MKLLRHQIDRDASGHNKECNQAVHIVAKPKEQKAQRVSERVRMLLVESVSMPIARPPIDQKLNRRPSQYRQQQRTEQGADAGPSQTVIEIQKAAALRFPK